MNENNKTSILDGIMYHSDGTFRPFLGHHGNISLDIAEHRNIYMEAEKNYFAYLLSNKKIRDYLMELLRGNSASEMFDEAISIQEKLETGDLESEQEKLQMKSMSPQERDEYHMQKLIYAEGLMCLLFAAVRDKALILDEIQCWEDRFAEIEETVEHTR